MTWILLFSFLFIFNLGFTHILIIIAFVDVIVRSKKIFIEFNINFYTYWVYFILFLSIIYKISQILKGCIDDRSLLKSSF